MTFLRRWCHGWQFFLPHLTLWNIDSGLLIHLSSRGIDILSSPSNILLTTIAFILFELIFGFEFSRGVVIRDETIDYIEFENCDVIPPHLTFPTSSVANSDEQSNENDDEKTKENEKEDQDQEKENDSEKAEEGSPRMLVENLSLRINQGISMRLSMKDNHFFPFRGTFACFWTQWNREIFSLPRDGFSVASHLGHTSASSCPSAVFHQVVSTRVSFVSLIGHNANSSIVRTLIWFLGIYRSKSPTPSASHRMKSIREKGRYE
jgi:hypothetical protein